MKANSGVEPESANGSKGGWASLDRQWCLHVCLAAPTNMPQWCRSSEVPSSRFWPGIVESAVPPILWRCFSSKAQATAANETGGMDISEGRSEDSAGMGYGSNTRLQWPRAAARPQGMRRMSGDRASLVWRLSGDVQRSAIEAVGEEEAGARTRGGLWGGPPAVHSLEKARARQCHCGHDSEAHIFSSGPVP